MSNTTCSYMGCRDSCAKTPGLKMFRIPKKMGMGEVWLKNMANPALKDKSLERIHKSNRVCQKHFKEEMILPSGRLVHGAVPEPYIKEEHEEEANPPSPGPDIQEEHEDEANPPSPGPVWRSVPAQKTYSSVTSEKIDSVDSENLTESSHQPTASTSRKASATVTSAASPQTIVKKSTIGKNSETQKISVRPVTQVAITTKPINDETAKLQEKIKQLEERNIQLEIENESYRIKNVMLETQKKKLIGQLQTIIKKKDPLDLGENTLVYEQHSERLTVGPSTSSATLSGKPQIAGSSATHSQDFSDVLDAGDDNAFLHSMEASEIEIDVDPEFETVDIKPNILLDNLPPLPPSPVPTKRRKRNSDQLETASSAAGKRSKSDQSLQRSCDFGDDDGDDDFQPDSGDDFDSEEDSAKVRRAYDLLKSVFDKKDKYDIFCNRLAGRLRGLKSPKVCRHVQQLLVTVVADAEAGRYDNVPG